MQNKDKPAFPGNRAPTDSERQAHAISYPKSNLESIIEVGLTKRELFALGAMVGMLAANAPMVRNANIPIEAWEIADATLEAGENDAS